MKGRVFSMADSQQEGYLQSCTAKIRLAYLFWEIKVVLWLSVDILQLFCKKTLFFSPGSSCLPILIRSLADILFCEMSSSSADSEWIDQEYFRLISILAPSIEISESYLKWSSASLRFHFNHSTHPSPRIFLVLRYCLQLGTTTLFPPFLHPHSREKLPV